MLSFLMIRNVLPMHVKFISSKSNLVNKPPKYSINKDYFETLSPKGNLQVVKQINSSFTSTYPPSMSFGPQMGAVNCQQAIRTYNKL